MSQWEPKPALDVNPWSLLPSIGFSKRATLVAESAWTLYVIVFLVYRSDVVACLLLGFIGGWALYYIARRLGGRVAFELGAAPEISSDSPFQLRLIADITHIGFFVLAAVGIAVWHA